MVIQADGQVGGHVEGQKPEAPLAIFITWDEMHALTEDDFASASSVRFTKTAPQELGGLNGNQFRA